MMASRLDAWCKVHFQIKRLRVTNRKMAATYIFGAMMLLKVEIYRNDKKLVMYDRHWVYVSGWVIRLAEEDRSRKYERYA
jgi:hypothetical protein